MNKNLKKFIATTTTSILIAVPLSSTVFALNEEQASSNNMTGDSLQIELSEKDIEELHNYFPENVNFSDDEIDKRLVASGEFTQEELDKINAEFDNNAKFNNNVRQARATYINGYNKYRTFKENGKEHLYIYVSGKTLQKIKEGAGIASTFGGFLSNTYAGLATVAVGSIIGKNMSGVNTKYGVVLKYVADKWNFQGATYTYRYDGWFYQT
jgi:hypothetical protein